MTFIGFPYGFDAAGRTAGATEDAHLREMLTQLLFTNAGERVNRPDFGSGILQLLFAPNAPELAAALEFNLRAAIQRHLGDVLDITALTVRGEDATLSIELRYVLRATGAAQAARFTYRA